MPVSETNSSARKTLGVDLFKGRRIRSVNAACRRAGLSLALAPLMLAAFGATVAADTPPQTLSPPKGLNLGSTSFFDGLGRQSEGWTVAEYDRYEALNSADGPRGAPNPHLRGANIDVAIALTQVIYTSAWEPLGGHFAFSAALPVVDFMRSSFSAASPVKLANNGLGVGDLVWGPIYQSKVSLKNGQPRFVWRAQLIISTPTGSLNGRKDLNQSSGFWAINPYVAFTYFPTRNVELSNRLNYQYNFSGSNFSDPPPIRGLAYRSGQAGQIIYDNFAASYAISPNLDVGVDGYALLQLNDDTTNGTAVPRSIEQELYMGPGLHLRFNESNLVNINSYMKIISRNEVSGLKINVQFIHRL